MKFDLDSKRVILDSQGLEMQGLKEISVKSRKKLAEETKSFRKLDDTAKIDKIGNLLKSYQEEIDKLTRRAKFSESSFLSLYKSFYTAPDPVSALESISVLNSRVNELEIENKKLKLEICDYEGEFCGLKNQDITIRNLEAKLQELQANIDDLVAQRVVNQVADVNVAAQLEIQTLLDQQKQMEKSLAESNSALNISNDVIKEMKTELEALRRRQEEGSLAQYTEVEFLAQEKELQTNLLYENEELKKKCIKLEEETRQQVYQMAAKVSKYEAAESETRISQLETQLELFKNSLNERQEYFDLEIKSCLNEKEELRSELESRPTWEMMKDVQEKLKFLEQLEYNVVEPDVAEKGQELNKEQCLFLKIRKLQTNIQQQQLTFDQLQSSAHETEEELQRKNEIIVEQAALIHRLEEDLANEYNVNRRKTVEKNTPILSQVLLPHGLPSSGEEESLGLLEIIRGQRDRFRERIKELENEKEHNIQSINTMKTTLQRLETDNIQLYETIRYLRNYKGDSTASRHENALHLAEEGVSNGLIENRYKNLYEEKMNPFTQFNHSEKQRRYKNLSAAEKITLMSTQVFLSNKFMRNFVFFYVMLLHILVMATLYSYTHFQCNN